MSPPTACLYAYSTDHRGLSLALAKAANSALSAFTSAQQSAYILGLWERATGTVAAEGVDASASSWRSTKPDVAVALATKLDHRKELKTTGPSHKADKDAPSRLTWWSGLSAALGGVLFGAWGYLHGVTPYVGAGVGVLPFSSPLLFLVGLVGFRFRCKLGESRLGDTGFGMGFLGTVIGVVKGAGLTVPMNWEPMLLAGLTLVGIVALKNEGSRGWGVLSLAMAALGWTYSFTSAYHDDAMRWVHVASGALFCLSWVALGIALLRDSRT